MYQKDKITLMIVKSCRILFLFCTFFIIISCSSKNTIEHIRLEIPAKNFSNYQFNINSRLVDRVSSSNELVMDYLKTRATLWKKAEWSDKAQWLGIKQSDLDAASRWDSDD